MGATTNHRSQTPLCCISERKHIGVSIFLNISLETANPYGHAIDRRIATEFIQQGFIGDVVD